MRWPLLVCAAAWVLAVPALLLGPVVGLFVASPSLLASAAYALTAWILARRVGMHRPAELVLATLNGVVGIWLTVAILGCWDDDLCGIAR